MYAEKLLPHDLEAEEAVVGSLLIDSDSFVRVAHVIKPGDFYRERTNFASPRAWPCSSAGKPSTRLPLPGS